MQWNRVLPYTIVGCEHRLIEIDGTYFVPKTGRLGRAKRIKRYSMSLIIRVREMARGSENN